MADTVVREIQGVVEIARQVFRHQSEALRAIGEGVGQEFGKAVALLHRARQVVVCGVGKSGIIGSKIAATLRSIGVPAVFLHPAEAPHGDLGIVQAGDVAVLISKSGTTTEVCALVPWLRRRGVPVIAIVGQRRSLLAEQAAVVLDVWVRGEACPLDLIPTTSTTAALVMGDALAIALMHLRGVRPEDIAAAHPVGMLGRLVSLRVRDVMHAGAAVPIVSPQTPFRQMLIEMTSKALGCVCVVEADGRLCGIVTDGDVRRTLQRTEDIRPLRVSDVMTQTPVTVSPEAPLTEALALMEHRPSQISVLPVVDECGVCVGVVRVHDIVRSQF
ncbi:MAG: KpsF/GutQ family sugar-phosphate isomerase [Candidatus Kapabacteria bacterium]|nr:KpsF/GutQ family sugar-phosphate isomerase [Candidatus Kapabacteria bacterium]MDW7996734.1 KpsF/GutQ family sugar-phosphate isomerase [Bacteroidota bacterium]MDW8225939.1 KpsF/GutQ family sugar-phosphate isomerase [Bacteroidota bacterium]